jgi:sec-independent protein translocase protein TatA
MGELLIILVIVMLIFGAGKLPGIGDALGRSIKNFKRASNGEDEIEVKKKAELEAKRSGGELSSGSDDVEEAELVSKRKTAKKEA